MCISAKAFGSTSYIFISHLKKLISALHNQERLGVSVINAAYYRDRLETVKNNILKKALREGVIRGIASAEKKRMKLNPPKSWVRKVDKLEKEVK